MTSTIIMRGACLWHFTLQYLHINGEIINHQKNRVDYCEKFNKNKSSGINVEEVKKYYEEKKLLEGHLDILKQEERDIFGYKKASVLLMDSYSELVDKLFINKKNGSSFCACYTDFNHTEDFISNYNCLDMISLDNLYEAYFNFFALFNKTYGEIPIIFINFPTKFENRAKYKERGKAIENVMEKISHLFSNIKIVKLDFCEKRKEDNMPYHFSNETYELLAKKISELNLKGISLHSEYQKKILIKFKNKFRLFSI